MIRSLRIENFRSHRLVELKDMGRINLVLGKNNTGKTALLEALLLLSLPSNPGDVLARMNESRGYGSDPDSEEMWDSVFHEWDHSQDVRVESEAVRS